MAEINAKVEYDNLLGFPDYNGSVINYLKSTESLYGFNNVSFNDIKQDLNLFNDNNIFNCVTEKNPNLIFYNNNYKLNLNKSNPFKYVDDNGTEHIVDTIKSLTITSVSSTDWVKFFIFFNMENEEFIEIKNNFFISVKSPEAQENDFWLSILDKNRIYQYVGGEWILTKNLAIAEIDIDVNNNIFIYNYPMIENWFDLTYKFNWKSAPSQNIKFPYSKSIIDVKNKFYDINFINKTEEYGYNIGDIAQLAFKPFIYVDDKFIGFLDGGQELKLISKEDGSEQLMTKENWDIIFKIY